MEELEIESIADKAKKFRVQMFKPTGWFSKFFNICYDSVAVDNLLTKAIIIKELAEDKIISLVNEVKLLSGKNNDLILEKVEFEETIKTLHTFIDSQKDKHEKEINKLSKTIQDLTYSKSNLEEEIKGLRRDLNDCNKKFEAKQQNNNKESGQFIDKVLKKNEKLANELKAIKEELKKKKIKLDV